MRRPRIFVSHSAHDQPTLQWLPVVNEKLTALGFDVFIDKERLKPGADWRREISDALRFSHAGLILISPPAFTSSWIQHEATILKERRDYCDQLVVVPVLIDVTPEQLCNKPFDALALNALEAIAHDDAKIWDQLGGKLRPVVERYRAPSRTDKLRWRIASLLKQLVPAEHVLRAALEQTGSDNPPPDAPLAEQLARQLTEIPLDRLGAVLGPLAQAREAKLVQLVDVLMPELWVDALAAERVALAAEPLSLTTQPAPSRRAIAVNGSLPEFTPRMYVARARDLDQASSVLRVTGVNDGSAEELLDEVRSVIAERLYHKPAMTLEQMGPRLRSLSKMVVVVLPAWVNGEHVTVLRNALPEVVFFLLTGSEQCSPNALPPNQFELIHPMLEAQLETQAEIQYDNAKAIVRPDEEELND